MPMYLSEEPWSIVTAELKMPASLYFCGFIQKKQGVLSAMQWTHSLKVFFANLLFLDNAKYKHSYFSLFQCAPLLLSAYIFAA